MDILYNPVILIGIVLVSSAYISFKVSYLMTKDKYSSSFAAGAITSVILLGIVLSILN